MSFYDFSFRKIWTFSPLILWLWSKNFNVCPVSTNNTYIRSVRSLREKDLNGSSGSLLQAPTEKPVSHRKKSAPVINPPGEGAWPTQMWHRLPLDVWVVQNNAGLSNVWLHRQVNRKRKYLSCSFRIKVCRVTTHVSPVSVFHNGVLPVSQLWNAVRTAQPPAVPL